MRKGIMSVVEHVMWVIIVTCVHSFIKGGAKPADRLIVVSVGRIGQV